MRCQNGLVIANFSGPSSNPTSAAELQTIAQGYVPAKNVSAVTDTFGRTAPANPLLSKNLIYTNCWNNTLVRAGCPSRCIILWQLLCQLPSASPAASAETLQQQHRTPNEHLQTLKQLLCPVQGQTTAQGSVYVTVTDNCPCAQVNATTGLICECPSR